jgi:FixJ family two-component response regulator
MCDNPEGVLSVSSLCDSDFAVNRMTPLSEMQLADAAPTPAPAPTPAADASADPNGDHRQAVVLIVDDDQDVRESLQWLVESVGLRSMTYASADQFIREYPQDVHGCLILDVRLPGLSGLDLQEYLLKHHITIPIIVVSGHGDVPVAVQAMKQGALDFLEKPFSDQALLDRIRDALSRDRQWRSDRQQRLAVSQRLARLTPRERQVMDLVVEGRLNKQIASALGLSHKTIEVHRAHVMSKMEADSVADLVRMSLLVNQG